MDGLDTNCKLDKTTHEQIKVDIKRREITIGGWIDAAYELWMNSSEGKREKAVEVAAGKREARLDAMREYNANNTETAGKT